ncbi:MAG: flippase-like domain-containing protein [Chloroflexi bacterium]|nr:MAG: flippase-like domain-containing protein [Chloroflexota bacterium]
MSGDAANNRLIARTSASLQRAIAWVRNRPRTLLATIIGLAIGVVVIWVSHPAAILESLGEVDPLPLLGALLLNVPVVALRAVRAQVVLRFLGHTVSFRSMLPVQLVGQTSSTVTPAASGDYLRAYIWRRQHDIPVRAGAAVVTFERLYSLFLLLALAVLARITSGRLLGRYASGALEMADNLRRLLRSPQLLTLASGITLTIYVLSGLQVALLITGLGDTIHITQAVAAYAISQTAGILSTLPFGLGASDAIVVTFLAGYGLPVGEAATVAVLLRGVSTLPQALAGLVAYLRLDGSVAPEPAAAGEVR